MVESGAVPFTLGVPLAFDSVLGGPEAALFEVGGGLLMLLVLFGGGCAPLLLDSGRGGAPLVARLVLVAPGASGPLDTVTGGYGRLGGGKAAGAGDGAGAAVGGNATGLALPAKPKGPLLSGGRPVVGKSNFRGAVGLGCTTPVDTVVVVAEAPLLHVLTLVVAVTAAAEEPVDEDGGNTPTELLPSDA